MSDLFERDNGDRSAGISGNLPELSVSDLSSAIKRTLEGAFGYVRVRGEIGRLSTPPSGHVYLSLKDDRAVIDGVIWKGQLGRLAARPEEGMEVIVTGQVTSYPGQSKYQIMIDSLEPAGEGALMLMLERRKKALAAEGLFAAEHKRPLPYLPEVIGVVTSPTGAVIRDILHRLRDRFPRRVLIWPVRVQGETSAREVAAAIRGFDALKAGGSVPRPDVLIVARGGGALEDLWGFNEEEVVRAVAACSIPLISAVGHETDTTLIDFVADKRAPTPTAAAEIAVPVRRDLLAWLAESDQRRMTTLNRALAESKRRLQDLSRGLPRADVVLAEQRLRLDGAVERLPLALRGNISAHSLRLKEAAGALKPTILFQHHALMRERSAGVSARLMPALQRRLERESGRLERAERLLESLSYRSVLARGYAVVRDALSKAPLPRRRRIETGQYLEIEFYDGALGTQAGAYAPGRLPKKTPPAKDAQRSLFEDEG